MRALVVIVMLLPFTGWAQRYKTVELKPITKQGWTYFYDLKKVGGPIALEVPLLALNDDEINRFYAASKTFRGIAAAVSFVPIIYLFTLPSSSYVDPTTFWIIIGGTLATQLGLEAMGHIKLGKAIDRYNSIIFQPSSNSIGLQVHWRF